jgi:uncharacterized membrane protein
MVRHRLTTKGSGDTQEGSNIVEAKGRWTDALVVAILVTLVLAITVVPIHADEPVVRAVLFYSTNCPHCHRVITEVLIPLTEQYGETLQIVAVNTSQTGGYELYLAAVEAFEIPPERRGVPTLIVSDVVLVGSLEIPKLFPPLVEQSLAMGGVDWPAIPGLAEMLAGEEPGSIAIPTPALAAAPTLPTDVTSRISANIARDPLGNSLSIAVLCSMVLSIGWVVKQGVRVWRGQNSPSSEAYLPLWRVWGVPVLCAVGLTVASYLAYVETRQVKAVCGPVGDCNAVQQSEYALLFGVLPVAVLGVVGYVAILAAWAWGRFGWGRLAELAPLALFGMALLGTLFSIYLTFLEPFVVGATCSWCLTSAVMMTLILLLVTEQGCNALCARVLRHDRE